MKTILHISKYYYPDLGGIENVAQQLAEGLSGYRNVVICFSHNKHTYYDKVDNIDVIRVGVLMSAFSQDISPMYYAILKETMEKYRPDAIHLHCPNPFVYPLVLRLCPPSVKVILHWHSDILGKGLVYKLVKGIERKMIERADYILATSPNYIDDSKPINNFPEKIRVLPNAVQTMAFDPKPEDEKAIRELRERYAGKAIVFIVGRHVPYKGIDRLIECEQYIRSDVKILIGGNGPETENLKRMAEGKERISFLGRLSADALRQHLWAADILGFTSNTKAEAFGIALAEGMYCKTVPVTFTIKGSGVNWVSVNEATGIEVELNNAEAYANAIDTLVASPHLKEKYAEAARNRVLEKFTQEKATEAARELYREFIGGGIIDEQQKGHTTNKLSEHIYQIRCARKNTNTKTEINNECIKRFILCAAFSARLHPA